MRIEKYPGLAQADFASILSGISHSRIGLVGDLCLDMYMLADMRLSELSREVPNYTLPVVEERTSPGGAGNVAANLAALRPASLQVLGVVGADWRGRLLAKALDRRSIPTDKLLFSRHATTNAYIKPMRYGYSETPYESPRLDYMNRSPLCAEDEAALLETLQTMAQSVDILCVCDQFLYGCITPRVRQRLCALAKDGLRVIVDSRERIGEYASVIVKPNEIECMRALGLPGNETPETLAEAALTFSARNGQPAIVTLGGNGCLVAEGGRVTHIPAWRVEGPTDICGAGDTFLSALACALGGGTNILDAAALGNLSSSITIAKLGETGTASREELCQAYTIRAARPQTTH